MGFVERSIERDKFGGNEDIVRVGRSDYKSMVLEKRVERLWGMRVKVVK